MTTYILTWNPSKTVWPFWDGVGEPPAEGLEGDWSTGGTKHGLVPGDRFFMLKQGEEPRGIVGSGVLTSKVRQDEHWDAERAGEVANYVDVEFDTILAEDDVLPVDDLIAHVEGKNWKAIPASGQKLLAPGDRQLEALWAEHVGQASAPAAPPAARPAGRTSTGRQSDAARRVAVEDHAQAMVEEYYRADGWTVVDRRHGNPYDALATRGDETPYLEAKGTEGDGTRVEVTSGEVNHARPHPGVCRVGIVSGIEWNRAAAAPVPGSGTLAMHDWNPDTGTLVPSRYQWSPPG